MATSDDDLLASLPPDPLNRQQSPAVPNAPSAVDAMLDSLGIQRAEPTIKTRYDEVSSDDPARAAKVMDLSRRFNQPMSFVDKNLALIEPTVNAPDEDYWRAFEKERPGSTKFLMDPKNMAAAHDDAENLGFFEGIVRDAGEGWRRGKLQVDLALLSQAQRAKGVSSMAYEPDIQKIESEMASIPDRGGVVRQFAQQLPNMLFSAKEGLRSGLPFASVGAAGAAAAGPLAPITVPAAAGVGMTIGGTLGYFEAAQTLEGELAFREFVNTKDESGKAIPREIAAKYADMVGAVNGTIEATADVLLTKFVGGPLLKAGGGLAMRVASRVPGAARLFSVIEENPKIFVGMTIGQAIRKAAMTLAKSEASEISTEVVQEVVTGVSGESAKSESGQTFDLVPAGEILRRASGVIVPTFQATLIPGLLGGGSNIYLDVRQMRRAEQAKQVYEAMGASAEASKLRERLPEAHREFVESVVKDSPVENIYIPAEAFETYFQSKNIDTVKAAEELGVGESFSHALESGGDVEVPLATWTSKLAGTEHYAGLSEDVKFHPDDMTQRQIKERTVEIGAALEKEASVAVDEDSDLLPGREAVYADIKSQLLDAGRPEAEASASAKVWAARAVVEAKRRGVTPEEWFQGANLRVVGNEPTRIKISRADLEARAAELQAREEQDYQPLSETADRWKELIGPGLRAPEIISGQRDTMGEYNQLPLWMKNKGGRSIDEVEQEARDAGLLREGQDVYAFLEKFRSPEKPRAKTKDYYEEARRSLEEERRLLQEAITPEGKGQERKNVEGQSAVYRRESPLSGGSPQAENIPQGLPETPKGPLDSVENGTPKTGQEGPRVHVPFEGKKSVFAQGVPWDISVTGKPGFDKWSADADAVVRRVAETAGVEPTLELSNKYWRGIHDEHHAVMVGTPQEKAAKIKSFKEKYPDQMNATNEMRILSQMDQLRSMLEKGEVKNAGLLMSSILKYYDDVSRPKAGIDAEKAGGQTLYQGPVDWLKKVFKRRSITPEIIQREDIPHGVLEDVPSRRGEFGPISEGQKDEIRSMITGWLMQPTALSRSETIDIARDRGILSEDQLFAMDSILDALNTTEDEYTIRDMQTTSGELEQYQKDVSVVAASVVDFFEGKSKKIDTLQLEFKDTFFQDPVDPRGFIDFTPRETLVTLVKADASTFIHESAHFWLRDMHNFVKTGKADEKYRGDWKVLSDWLGVASDQVKLTEDQQEKFARGFELYLREGKTPSLELKNVFRLFRRWLTKVYRSSKSLNVEISDDVRGVMDRMVASEDEIDAARRVLGYDRPLPDEGLSQLERSKMEVLREQSRQEAIEALFGAQLKELTPEHKAFLARELERARHAATEQAEGLARYRAMREIARAFKGDNPSDAKRIAADYMAGKMREKEGMAFDLLADRLGFGSGDEMAKSVTAARDTEAEISDRVELWMSQFKDMRLLESSFREEAIRVAHNSAQEEFAAMEHDVLIRKAVEPRDGDESDAKTWRPRPARLEARVARERAKDIIAARPVRRAGDYTRYFANERRNAEDSARAAARGDFEKAADFKRKQLFNHALAMESLKAKEEIEKIKRYLDRFANRDQDMKDMPFGFIHQIDKLLSAYKLTGERDWDRSLANVANDMRSAGEQWDVIANATGLLWDGQKLAWRPETLIELVDRVGGNYRDIAVPPSILNGRPGDYKWMALSDFRDLRTAVQAISGIGKGYDRFLSQFIKVDMKEAAAAIQDSIEAGVGDPHAEGRVVGHPDSAFIEKWKQLTLQPGDRFLDFTHLLSICRYLDGGKDDGPMQNYVYRVLTRSENEKLRATRAMTDEMNTLLEKHFTKAEFKKLRTEKVYFEFMPGGKKNLTREEMIAVALNTGNAGNMDRLMADFMPKVGNKDLTREELVVARRENYTVFLSNVQTILNSLTKKEMDFVQATWDYIDTYWPKIMELDMRVTGVQPEKVAPAEVVTIHGRYRGGYYPIAYDFTKSAEARKNEEQLNELYKQYGSVAAHTRRGHTQKRVDHMGRPLRLSLDVLFRHLENVVHDLSFRAAVIDVNRLLREKNVREAVANALGPKGMGAIEGSLKSVASDQGEFLDGIEKAVRWVRFGATMSRLGLRPVKMPGDISVNVLLGIQEIGVKRLSRAMTDFVFNPRQTVKFVNEKSERMLNRAAMRDRDLRDLARKWGGESVVKNMFFLTMSICDQAVSYPLWNEVYRHNLLSLGEEKARLLADETVTLTFGSGSVIDQAAIQRGNEYKKTITWFYSWCGMMFNRAWIQGRMIGLDYDRKNYGKAVYSATSSIALLWILPGLIEGLFMEMFRNAPDRDDEKWKKRLLSRVVSQGFGYIPGLRDAAGFLIDRSMGVRSAMDIPLQSAITTYLEPMGDFIHSLSPDYDLPDNWWENATEAVFQSAGVPQQFRVLVFNFIDWMSDRGELTWRDLLSRRTKR